MNGKRNSPGALMGDSSLSHGSEYRPRVLVVDDESMIADTVTKILSLSGYAATAAYDGEDALESALLVPPQLMITDVMLPGMNGIELAITMRRIYPECKILLFSGQASTADLMISAKHAGHHFTLLSKPMPPQDLLAEVAKHLEQNGDPRNAAVA
jgi:DNA-binding response OmpR family regulator